MTDPAGGPDAIDAMQAAWRVALPGLDPAALDLVGRVMVLAGRLEKRADGALAKHEMTLGQFDILATLRRQPGHRLSPSQLLKSVILSSGGMTSRLDRLAEVGLVARTADPADRRGVVVALTAKGKKRIDAAAAARFAEADAALPAMNEAERGELVRLLRQWVRHLAAGV